jgi:hypothetical protein
MGRPRLTEYLLKLATNAAELEKYDCGPKKLQVKLKKMTPREREIALNRERDALLKRAGVTPEQRRCVLSGDSRAITEAVIAELAKNSSTEDPFYGTGLAVVVPINGVHLQQAGRRHLQRVLLRPQLHRVEPKEDK